LIKKKNDDLENKQTLCQQNLLYFLLHLKDTCTRDKILIILSPLSKTLIRIRYFGKYLQQPIWMRFIFSFFCLKYEYYAFNEHIVGSRGYNKNAMHYTIKL
jgi:hypothetical protein